MVEESMYVISAGSEIKGWKISVCSQPVVGSHAQDFPKHIPIK